MVKQFGQWHPKNPYFGMHFDLHAGLTDTELGTRADPDELAKMFKLMGAQWVQADCKGHPGYTSWFSKVPNASVSPGVKKDVLAAWRKATRKLGIPLHCHYSGIWDSAAGAKHPEWAVKTADGKAQGAPGQNSGATTNDVMCPRSDYLRELLIPQMLELIDRYEVDGFWVDGDIWAVKPCYCERCTKAFAERTGLATPPLIKTDPNWLRWIRFTRASYEEYVTAYVDAVHAHKPGVLVCSNWLQTLKNPGEPKVPTDWISGDVPWVFTMDGNRVESRFLSTRQKHWDLMLWGFYASRGMGDVKMPWAFKPVQMLQQEAAAVVALGGHVQIYDNPGVRTGQLVEWHQKRLGQVGKFVMARRMLCQASETIPQVAVLHSEHHLNAQPIGNLLWEPDTAGVSGAVLSLLENHFGVDVLDEWALLPRIDDFTVIVAPEMDNMSNEMVEALRQYVTRGGRLLITGAAAYDRFGAAFLGTKIASTNDKATYHIQAADGSVAVYSEKWHLLRPTSATAFGTMGTTPLLDERIVKNPVATINKVGKGLVAYAPFELFHAFERTRLSMLRTFIGDLTRALAGRQAITVQAPTAIDVILRQKGKKKLIHLLNRLSGIPNRPEDGCIDEIPAIGPVQIEMDLVAKPKRVSMAFEKTRITWKYTAGKRGGKLVVNVPLVQLHCAVVVE